VEGFLCELQVNTRAMSRAKHEGGGHEIYEQTRFVHGYLLYAAIKNDQVGVQKLLGTGKATFCDMVKDKNGFTALAFACVHLNAAMVEALLAAGSSAARLSKSGWSGTLYIETGTLYIETGTLYIETGTLYIETRTRAYTDMDTTLSAYKRTYTCTDTHTHTRTHTRTCAHTTTHTDSCLCT
jgi:hypothetical protein